jgi:hypothetical protein
MPLISSAVPVSKDGSKFDSIICCRAGGYTIGPKGNETKILDYSDALAALTSMSPPRWRRPNLNGNWGLVTGISWTSSV